MLTDHVCNLLLSQDSVVILSTLLFDTDSLSEKQTRDNLLQCRRNLRIKHFEVGEISSPAMSQVRQLILQSRLPYAVHSDLDEY